MHKKLLLGAGVAAVTAAAVTTASYALTKQLVGVAMERQVTVDITDTGKAKKQIQGYAIDKAFLDALKQGEETLRGYDTETVEIESYDGTRLVGHWRPCEHAKRVLVAMHGWRSSWAKDFGTVADSWFENDCHVLFVEQRGQGESGGDYMGFGLMERFDCLEWVKWVNEVKGDDLPIYLVGVSMGAASVLMASDLEMPQNVHGIVADCGFTSPHAIWKHVVESNLRLSYGLLGRIADDMCKKKIRIGTKEFSAADALRNTDIPVLFIHGTDDHFVPVEMTYENYKACKAPKRLLVVPGADHGMSYYTDREQYEQIVREFWADFDGVAPVKSADKDSEQKGT